MVVTVLALGCAGGSGGEGAGGERPSRADLRGAAEGWNLVLVTVDTLRADRLNSYGYDRRTTSPAMDSLAQRGIRFDQASAPRASTWPSLATVLTGLQPSGHGVIHNGLSFPEGLPILPELLSRRGYVTGAFLSNMCDAGHHGWDDRQCSRNASDENLLDNAGAWLDRVAPPDEDGRPVFLWTHFFGAHGPYYNGGDLAARWNPDYDGIVAPKRGVLNRIQTEGIELDEADLEHLDAVYDAAVRGTDARIARLLEDVGEHLDPERTIIVLLSDHGEDLYQHNGYLYHSCSVYQTGLHVPLVLVAPGLALAGAVARQPVELADVLPTLLELLGVEPPECVHGGSLLPYLVRPERDGEGKPALSEYGSAPIGTVRSGRWKLIENPTGHRQKCLPGTDEDFYVIGRTELYDLTRDPYERTDISAGHPDVVEELSAMRQELIGNRCSAGVVFDSEELSPETIEALENMGYVVG